MIACRFLPLLLSFVFVACAVQAQMPSHPEGDAGFLRLPDGTWLNQVQVSGVPLSLSRGSGAPFQVAEQAAYAQLKADSQTRSDSPLQWTLMDLDAHQVLSASANPKKKLFGASIAKIFAAGTLLDKQAGQINAGQLQLLADMLVISSNTAWMEIQSAAGGGDADLGRAANLHFTQRLGYPLTRGFQGTWGTIHGNELNAAELAEYLYATYQGHYPGAETVWKVMHTSRTGTMRAKKYIPSTQFLGSKTGTYDGPTVDPDTGRDTLPDGKPVTVSVRHQVLVFNLGGHEYGLAILANTGSDESAGLLAGGLYRELAATPLWARGAH